MFRTLTNANVTIASGTTVPRGFADFLDSINTDLGLTNAYKLQIKQGADTLGATYYPGTGMITISLPPSPALLDLQFLFARALRLFWLGQPGGRKYQDLLVVYQPTLPYVDLIKLDCHFYALSKCIPHSVSESDMELPVVKGLINSEEALLNLAGRVQATLPKELQASIKELLDAAENGSDIEVHQATGKMQALRSLMQSLGIKGRVGV